MCISPIRIRNPNFGINNKGTEFKDTVSAFINVPCGHCCECVAIRQMSYVQRIQLEAKKNHLFFCTLTYNNESLPEIGLSNGYVIRYADIADVQKMIKRLRKSNVFGRPFRYFGVSELGSKRGRPHFHLLFLLPKHQEDEYIDILNLEQILYKSVLFEWRRNYGSCRKPIYKPLCTPFKKWIHGKLKSNYDLHYVNPSLSNEGTSSVAFYVTKYMMKPSDRETRLQQALKLNLPEEEYESVWSLVRSRTFNSLGLGLNGELTPFGVEPDPDLVSYVRSCVELSKKGEISPKFYVPETGASFPLSRYYRSKFFCYGYDDAKYFNQFSRDDNVVLDEDSLSEKVVRQDKFNRNVKLADLHDQSDILDLLYE